MGNYYHPGEFSLYDLACAALVIFILSVTIAGLVFVLFPPASASIFDDAKTIEITYEGKTDITNLLDTKSTTTEKTAILKDETIKALDTKEYPLEISTDEKNSIIIEKYECDKIKCGYWIKTETRKINNPVWLITGNIPYYIVINDIYDVRTNTEIITIKEDINGVIFEILTDFVNGGKP